MKMKLNFYFILLGLIIIVLAKETKSKKKKTTTEITIVTDDDLDEREELDVVEEEEEEAITKQEIEIDRNKEKGKRKNATDSESGKGKKEDSEKKGKEGEKGEEDEGKGKEGEKDDEEGKDGEKGDKDDKKGKKGEKDDEEGKEGGKGKKDEDEEGEGSEDEESDEHKEKDQKSTDEKEKEKEREIRESKKDPNYVIPPEKILVIKAPYQDNEDYIISPLGLGTPVNFVPLQIDTTSYKSWVSSASNKDKSNSFSYDKKDSKTSEDPGEWDTVVDEEGTISGNVIYDNAHLGKFEINHFKFIEAVEYEDDFKDYKYGKMGLGNCYYADDKNAEYCLIQRLKDSGSIERRIFSLREYSDTHGEIVIGSISSVAKEKDYPLLSVVGKDVYEDIEDDEFKMSWLTKVSHVIFKDGSGITKNIFKNNIYTNDGLASFDSSSHYIEAPYSYINEFQEKMFDKYYPNICRKVNNDGTYMFLCNKEKYEEYEKANKDLSLVIVMDGNGFEIPMDLLFEQTREKDYEFFIHFKDYEQNIWNLGHPFFHQYTIIFDYDNQEIGIEGENILDLKDQTDSFLSRYGKWSWWKTAIWIFIGLLLLIGFCLIIRYFGIKYKLDNGVSPSLVDNESVDDLSFAPGQKVN